MIEPQFDQKSTAAAPRSNTRVSGASGLMELSIPDQYDSLLRKLARAERALESKEDGQVGHIEEASAMVFDLLYNLDFKHGGELVPRLAGLYAYLATELANVGRTGDLLKLRHLRDMISTLRRSWTDDDDDGDSHVLHGGHA